MGQRQGWLSLATNRKHDSQECEQADLFFHIKSLWWALQQCHKDPHSTLLLAPCSPLPPWSRVRVRGPVHLWGHRIPEEKGGRQAATSAGLPLLLRFSSTDATSLCLLSHCFHRATLTEELGGSAEYELQAPERRRASASGCGCSPLSTCLGGAVAWLT